MLRDSVHDALVAPVRLVATILLLPLVLALFVVREGLGFRWER